METSGTLQKIQDWLALSRPEYCDKHGHRISGWSETAECGQHTLCDHCGQGIYRPQPEGQMSRY